ncbi:MAG TPA: PIN domain-containing protein, partial [Pyrinomonadaceae bacterium]|nr:PIN domain-containing protein [Pyrinomonadaceae bacterium]
MSYLVDTNVLLRSVQKTHPMHKDAARAIRVLLARGEELCITPQNLIEFWAVATRPVAANGLGLTTVQAARRVRRLKKLFKLQP